MKHKLLTITMIIAGLLFPLEINAKKPASVVLLKDANGVEIGRVIGMEHVSSPYVLTNQGYRTSFAIPLGMVNARLHTGFIFYESIDCAGIAYVGHFRYLGTVFMPPVTVDAAYNAGTIFYTQHDAQLESVNVNSALDTSDFQNINCSPVVDTVDVS